MQRSRAWLLFAGSAAAARAALAIVQSNWAAMDGGSEERPVIDDSAVVGADGLPSPSFLEALLAQPGSSQPPLLRSVLLGALRALPELGAQVCIQHAATFLRVPQKGAIAPF